MNKLKKAFADDPEVLRALEHRELLAKSGDLIETPHLEALKKLFKGDKGDKGDVGLTEEEKRLFKQKVLKEVAPVKFVDYFTKEEVEEISNYIRRNLRREVTPKKGVDYFDGKDGKDGRDGIDAKQIDENLLLRRFLSRVPKPEKVDLKPIKEELKDELEKIVPTKEDFLKYLKSLKGNDRLDISNIRNANQKFNMSDQRWHGGGLSKVEHDATLTGDGTPESPLSATAGAGDVVGPASATDGAIPLYDGVTGKLIKDSVYTPASFAPALGPDDNYVTDAEKIVIGNTSGTNTGDQDLSGLVTKATYDANSILYATTDDTPVALVVAEQTVVGRVTGTTIGALAIDSDLTTVSTNDDTLPSAKATKTYADTKIPLLTAEDTYSFTGFTDGDNITISYDHSTRKVTLTGDLTYYWQGTKKSLTSPWTSDAHTATVGPWFLSTSDGTNFTWSVTPWAFSNVMVAYVNYGATAAESFALRETHGTMDYLSHQEFHSQIGTYRVSGGILTVGTYTQNTATDAATTPGFDAAVIKDEDVSSVIPAWTQGTYTTAYVGASSTLTFNIAASFPFVSAGSYIQVNNTTTGAMTNGIANRFYNVYQIMVPATSDADSQKYRMIMLQPQATYTSLAAARSEDIRGLQLGNLSNLATEFVAYARITYATAAAYGNTGKCVIATNGVSYVVGNRAGVASVSGFTPTNHAGLINLDWTNTGHTGSTSVVAGFDASGLASEYAIDTNLASVSASDDTVPSAKATKAYADLMLPLAGGTMSGNITLGENTAIALDPAGSADGKYTGITVTGTAGYAQTFGDLVYLDPTDSRWEKTDANAASAADGDSRGLIGVVVVAGAADGNACTILLQGIVRADAAFPAFTINNPIYVSETAGAVTQTQPTTTDVVIRIIGSALTADEMYFNPDWTWTTHT